MLAIDRPLDCPECSSAGSVTREFCEVCYAEVGEYCEPGVLASSSSEDAAPSPVAPLPAMLD